MEYHTERSETIFRGKVFSVRRDVVKTPAGVTRVIDVVEHGGAVTMMPVDEQERILFVRQYRHAAGEYVLELPAGTLDPGEDPHDCAVRECREEIGMTPGRLIHLGDCYLAPGYSSELNHMYLALDLSAAPLAPDEDEEISVEPVPLSGLREVLRRGEIRDGKSLAILLLALPLVEHGMNE